MSSAPQIEPFRGSSTWEECSDFIRAIRAAAWREGKLRDLAWMADFASLYFTHKALLWHSRLSEDVRRDWSKLETEILTRWAPSEGDDGETVEPTPAAAPSLGHIERASSPLQGPIKIVVDESSTTYYLKFQSGNSPFGLTKDATEALRVRCNSLPNGTLLERIDHCCHSWLAIHWNSSSPGIENGSINSACIACVNSDTLKSSWQRDYPMQLLTCTVLENGEIMPVWKTEDTGETILVTFVTSSTPFLAADPTAYSKAWKSEKRARLFIECSQNSK